MDLERLKYLEARVLGAYSDRLHLTSKETEDLFYIIQEKIDRQTGWISVEEDLPKDRNYYLVQTKEDDITIAYLESAEYGIWHELNEHYHTIDVLRWRSLLTYP